MDERHAGAFERLIEGASTEGRERLRRVQSELGLKENDGLWGVIGALEYYQSLYEATPARIEKVVDKALNAMELSARAASEYAAERTRAVLVDKVSDGVLAVAGRSAHRPAAQSRGAQEYDQVGNRRGRRGWRVMLCVDVGGVRCGPERGTGRRACEDGGRHGAGIVDQFGGGTGGGKDARQWSARPFAAV
jgi:hypothetical protein